MTHAYGDRSGVRWLSRGLKVYYLPIPEMFRQCTYTTFFSNFAAFRSIVIRERIHIIHGHQVWPLPARALLHSQAPSHTARTVGALKFVPRGHHAWKDNGPALRLY